VRHYISTVVATCSVTALNEGIKRNTMYIIRSSAFVVISDYDLHLHGFSLLL